MTINPKRGKCFAILNKQIFYLTESVPISNRTNCSLVYSGLTTFVCKKIDSVYPEILSYHKHSLYWLSDIVFCICFLFPTTASRQLFIQIFFIAITKIRIFTI